MPTPSGSERLLRKVVVHGGRRRALAGFAALSVGDFFVPALPTQSAVIALSLLQPRRAAWIVLGFASAAALGVLVMALLVAAVDATAQRLAGDVAPQAWAQATDLLRRHGLWIVFAASVFPTPPRVLVASALLAGIPAALVAGAVFAGKCLWFGAVVGLLLAVPQRLLGAPWLGARIRRLHELRAQVQTEKTP